MQRRRPRLRSRRLEVRPRIRPKLPPFPQVRSLTFRDICHLHCIDTLFHPYYATLPTLLSLFGTRPNRFAMHHGPIHLPFQSLGWTSSSYTSLCYIYVQHNPLYPRIFWYTWVPIATNLADASSWYYMLRSRSFTRHHQFHHSSCPLQGLPTYGTSMQWC